MVLWMGSQLVLLAHQLTATSTCPGTSKGRSGGTESERLYVTLINNKLHPPPIQHPPPIGRADRRNAPKGAQRARRLADARGESNTVRGKPELGMWVGILIIKKIEAQGLGSTGLPKGPRLAGAR